MEHSTVSMLVFSVYMVTLCVITVVSPDYFAALFGLGQPGGLWVRVFGMLMGILAFYYLMAVREVNKSFYRWTVHGRLAVFPTLALFVILGFGPPILLLFGAWDSGCGIWTGLALRREETVTAHA
jgi:hypothetical protein